MKRLKVLLAVVACCGPAFAGAAASERPFIFGVGTHFAFTLERGYRPEAQRAQIAELGVDSFRDDVDEGAFVGATPERPLGARLDRLNEMVAERVARPVLILRSRMLAEDPAPRFMPTNPAEFRVFADFAARVVPPTRSFRPIYELWNEWNVGWRERPTVGNFLRPRKEDAVRSPENYVGAASAAYAAIKAKDPDSFVLTGSIGDDYDWEWTRRAMAAGLTRTGDGISVHFYNHCNAPADRTAENLIERTQEFAKIVRDGSGPRLPIYVTEFGWPNDDGPCGIPLDLAAANVAQYALWASTVDWIGGVWAYELRDSGQKRDDREDNFGLYTYDNRPKPAACAYREAIALARTIRNARFRDAPSGIRWLEGTAPDGSPLWVFWTTRRDARATMSAEGGPSPIGFRTLCSGEAAAAAPEFGMMPIVVRPADAGIESRNLSLRLR